MRTRRVAPIVFGAFAALVPISASATIIIDSTTQGFYNDGLGDLSLDSVLGAQTDIATGFNLFPALNSSMGDPLIPAIASEPNLAGADAGTVTALGNFLGNTSVLGGSWSLATQAIPTTWTINDETAVVYEFVVGSSGLSSLLVDVGADNGVFAWFDGVYQFGALAPGNAFPGEYVFDVGAVAPGTHYLQFLREDHGGAASWTISVDAVDAPEPSMTLLFTLAAAGLIRRRGR